MPKTITRQVLLFILSISLLISCGRKHDSSAPDGEGSFSLQKGHVAFTYFKNNVGSIYYTTNIDSVAQRLTFPKKGWDLTFQLTKDLSKILYINYAKSNYEVCNICLYDLESKKTDTLLKGGQFITGVCISNDKKNVYFCNASEIKNYSPIAPKAPHGMDIFKINVETKKIQKLTNLNAYSIHALKTTSSDSTIVANIYDKNGLVLISTKTGYIKEININSPRNDVKTSFDPVDIRSDSIMYTALQDLYKHNLKTNKSELILDSPNRHLGLIQPDDNWTNILFNIRSTIYFYNVPTKKLREVKLRIR